MLKTAVEENPPMVLKPPPEAESVLKYAIPLAGSERQKKQIKEIQSKLNEYVAELEDIYGKDNGETTAKYLPRQERQLVNLLSNCRSAAEELDTTISEQHQILESLLRWFQSQMQLLVQLGEEDLSTDRDELDSPDTITELISEITDISCKLEQMKKKYQDLSKPHLERPFTAKIEEENKEFLLSMIPDLKAGSENSNKQLERIVQELGKSFDKQAGELQNIEKRLRETENKYMKAEADNQVLMEEKRALEFELRKIKAMKAYKRSPETAVLNWECRLDMATLPIPSAVTPDAPQQESQTQAKLLEQLQSQKTIELQKEAEPFPDPHLPSLHKNAKMQKGENQDLYKTPGTPDLLEGNVTEDLDATVPEEKSDILYSQTQGKAEQEPVQSSRQQETSLLMQDLCARDYKKEACVIEQGPQAILEYKVVQKPADQRKTSAGFHDGSMEIQDPYDGDYNKEAHIVEKGPLAVLEEQVPRKRAAQTETSVGFYDRPLEVPKADEADEQHKLPTVKDGSLTKEVPKADEADKQHKFPTVQDGPLTKEVSKADEADKQCKLPTVKDGSLTKELPKADEADKQHKLPTVQDGPLAKETQEPYERDCRKKAHIIELGPQSELEDNVPQKSTDQTETSSGFHEGYLEVQKAEKVDKQQKIPIVKDGPLTKQIQDPYEGDYREEAHLIKQGPQAALEDKVLQKQKETSAGFHEGSLEVQKACEADKQKKMPIVKVGPITKQVQKADEAGKQQKMPTEQDGPLTKLTDQQSQSDPFELDPALCSKMRKQQEPLRCEVKSIDSFIQKQGDENVEQLGREEESTDSYIKSQRDGCIAEAEETDDWIKFKTPMQSTCSTQEIYSPQQAQVEETDDWIKYQTPKQSTWSTQEIYSPQQTEQQSQLHSYEMSLKTRMQQTEQQPQPFTCDELGPAKSLEMTKQQTEQQSQPHSYEMGLKTRMQQTEQQCHLPTYELDNARSLRTRMQQTEQQSQPLTYELGHAKNLNTRMQQTEQESQPQTYELVHAKNLKTKMQQTEQQSQLDTYHLGHSKNLKTRMQQTEQESQPQTYELVHAKNLKTKMQQTEQQSQLDTYHLGHSKNLKTRMQQVQHYHNIIPKYSGSQLYIQGRSITLTPKYLSTKTTKCDAKAQKDMLKVPNFLSDETPK